MTVTALDPQGGGSRFGCGYNQPGVFTGAILNRKNIGKTPQELVDLWNKEHP